MNKKKLFDRGEDHQHFGLRKLTIGVASVLLGTTFMIYGGHAVQAADTTKSPANQPSTTEVESKPQEANKPVIVSGQKSNVDRASEGQNAAAQVKPAAKAAV